MRRSLRVLFGLGLVVAATVVPTTVTQAAPSRMQALQSEINQVLSTTRGGVQISSNSIAWAGGKVVLTIPTPGQRLAPADTQALNATQPDATSEKTQNGCPYADSDASHYFCFYQDINFGGRRLQFADCPQSTSFDNYGFDDMTSSWVNTKHTAEIVVTDVLGDFLWDEGNPATSSYVGNANNDRATDFTCTFVS